MGQKIIYIILLSVLSGCSLDASLVQLPAMDKVVESPDVENLIRKEPDFISGELVTTSNNYQIKAAFGEISEKKELSNGYTIEGVFYE